MKKLDLDWGSSNNGNEFKQEKISLSNDHSDHIHGRGAMENNNEMAAETNDEKTDPVAESNDNNANSNIQYSGMDWSEDWDSESDETESDKSNDIPLGKTNINDPEKTKPQPTLILTR